MCALRGEAGTDRLESVMELSSVINAGGNVGAGDSMLFFERKKPLKDRGRRLKRRLGSVFGVCFLDLNMIYDMWILNNKERRGDACKNKRISKREKGYVGEQVRESVCDPTEVKKGEEKILGNWVILFAAGPPGTPQQHVAFYSLALLPR